MTTIPLIVNPTAGGGRCGALADGVAQRLAEAGRPVEVLRTRGPAHASDLARQVWAAGHRTLLCAGGDGTTFEVVDGLFPLEGDEVPTLGILPLGTGNSFLKDFDLDDADKAIAAVVQGTTRPVDIVRATTTDRVFHYVNLLSVGFTSAVGETMNRRFKRLGPAGYAVATVVETVRLKARPFPHRLDGGDLDTAAYDFLSFSNSRCTGGDMQMAPAADVADGRVDVVRIGDLGRIGLLTAFPKIYAGTHLELPKNSHATAARVDFELAGPEALMVDGEVFEGQLLSLEVQPSAMQVFA